MLIQWYYSCDYSTLEPVACLPSYVKDKSDLFVSENTAFLAAASYSALADGYERNNPSSTAVVVRREAQGRIWGWSKRSRDSCKKCAGNQYSKLIQLITFRAAAAV